MKLTIKQLIEQNNEKRKLLTPDNESYFSDLLIYIRMKPFKNERATEELLLDLLNQLLDAQQEGKSAKELFGSSPKQLANEMIQSLPQENTKSIVEFGLEIIFTLFGWFLIIWGIWPVVKKEDPIIHIGSAAISAILLIASMILLVYLIIKVLRNSAFTDEKKKKVATWTLSILVGLLFAVGFLINFLVEPFGPEMTITYYTPFGLGCFFLLASYILKKYREALV
ncbi:DUF1129 family protein [Ureibacillus acetophenoni]|uniref:Uncharacterized protein DUF1129 n=1 Tax=Ureibacillus acetophenoni TaxID=614649 RepID=A0A285U813_9BACL|nr:DUF1129 family protein [Ureibacillus acetophenoni]SOC38074.1 uncharacterized protein DUF1129 [Ureibacillus acetophenoni]